MATIHFHIHYLIHDHSYVAVELFKESKGEINTELIPLHTYGDGHWIGEVEHIKKSDIRYRYIIISGNTRYAEGGADRVLHINVKGQVFLEDQWRAPNDNYRIFDASAFRDVIFKPAGTVKSRSVSSKKKKTNFVTFQLDAPDIPNSLTVGITGSSTLLGGWKKAILLSNEDFPLWQITLPVDENLVNLEFKYVLCRPDNGEIVSWEDGDNQALNFNFPGSDGNLLVVTHHRFRHANYRWRGTGVAIPVFSIRSKRGFGIGEFLDLKGMVDFASSCGMNMVQILPVNDTIAAKTWKDSYPYSAISVFALHPLYINVEGVGAFKKKSDHSDYGKERDRLNLEENVDFVGVMESKLRFLRILYEEKKSSVFRSKAYKAYFEENRDWLIPYAAFCYLRDKNGTADFKTWKQHSEYDDAAIKRLSRKSSKAYDEIAFFYFLQYFADKQLKEVRDYGREKRVVLKGDLPIGVYRYSCDAWIAPGLYHMDGQAGAPPDDYAEDGQNWGFPTYNWEVMARDNFLWWRQRMQSLAEYFDALRIDHILGFFRIWEIPIDQVSGVLGKFNPRIPLSVDEIRAYGIDSTLGRYTDPYIREYMLNSLFGKDRKYVKKEFLESKGEGIYHLKANVTTQQKINARFQLKKYKNYGHLKDPLFKLVSEVLLLPEKDVNNGYNPRITFHKTYSYKGLEPEEQRKWDALYHDYFYERHNEFWKDQAMWKLPALLGATDMFICGEDLGMIPASVAGVMQELNIVSLEIQRMPKGPTAFGMPSQYDYMSVCSPSCHDMSTIRGWWESDTDRAQRFYNLHMHRTGLAPAECSVDIVRFINQEHLNSSSILAIFPIQDLLGMDADLRKEDAASEQINDPANSNHYWRYRLHLNIEDILEEKVFIEGISIMIKKTGR